MQKIQEFLGFGSSKMQEQGELSLDIILEDKIKFGRSQRKTILALMVLWLSDGAEMILIGFIIPLIQKEWDLQETEVNMVGTIIFLGIFLGAFTVGTVADKIGRRTPALVSSLGILITSILSAYSPSFFYFLVTRGLFGFFMGIASPLITGYLAEIIPQSMRAKRVCWVNLGFIFGEIIGLFCVYIFLDTINTGNWRALLVVASIPGFFALILCYKYVHESPRFLMVVQNRKKKGIDILEEMYFQNHFDFKTVSPQFQQKSHVQAYLNEQRKAYKFSSNEKHRLEKWVDNQNNQIKNQKQTKLSQLFSAKNRKITFLISVIWFSLSFIYYGILIILPLMVIKFRQRQQLGNQNNNYDYTHDYDNNNFDGELIKNQENKLSEDIFNVLLTLLAEIPAVFMVMLIVENPKIGRKNIIFTCFVVTTILCFYSFILNELNLLFYIILAIIRFFVVTIIIIAYPFTAELYDTSIRITGMGFSSSVNRFGGILISWVSALGFYMFGPAGPMVMFGIFSSISSIGAFLIPKDTTNIPLDQYHELSNVSNINNNSTGANNTKNGNQTNSKNLIKA